MAVDVNVQLIPRNGKPLAVVWTPGDAGGMKLKGVTGREELWVRNVSNPTASATVNVEGVESDKNERDVTRSAVLAASGDAAVFADFEPGDWSNAGDVDANVSPGVVTDVEFAWVRKVP